MSKIVLFPWDMWPYKSLPTEIGKEKENRSDKRKKKKKK